MTGLTTPRCPKCAAAHHPGFDVVGWGTAPAGLYRDGTIEVSGAIHVETWECNSCGHTWSAET